MYIWNFNLKKISTRNTFSVFLLISVLSFLVFFWYEYTFLACKTHFHTHTFADTSLFHTIDNRVRTLLLIPLLFHCLLCSSSAVLHILTAAVQLMWSGLVRFLLVIADSNKSRNQWCVFPNRLTHSLCIIHQDKQALHSLLSFFTPSIFLFGRLPFFCFFFIHLPSHTHRHTHVLCSVDIQRYTLWTTHTYT